MNGSITVLRCTCENKFQDKEYGKLKRVHNIGGTTHTTTYKCTSCGEKKK